MERQQDDREGISGGRFVQPAADFFLPPTREYKIQMEPGVDMPFHFGSIGDMAGAGITSIQINSGTGTWADIWRNGVTVTPAPTIPVGTNWELRVNFNASSTTALWAACITVVAPEAQTGRTKQSANVRYATGGTYNDSADFNMGAMPASNVNLRVKCWATDYYTVDPPPDSPPTTW